MAGTPSSVPSESTSPPGPLHTYFEGNIEGPGIYKWTHYFEIYERHFARFRDKAVHVAEVGVYSGGSLRMWKWYLGNDARITGIDIEPACRAYADDRTTILIGDQGNRDFWRTFRDQRPKVDIFIDDGGHLPEQQIATLEEVLPHMAPGGVYLCEDIHGSPNAFSVYINALAEALHTSTIRPTPDGGLATDACPWQARVTSVHLYPFVAVLEMSAAARSGFEAVKRGTEWQPFVM